MKKHILIFIFCISFLNANILSQNTIDISVNEQIQIYKSIQITTNQNIKNIEDAINNPEEFKEVKYFRRYLYQKKPVSSSWYKLNLVNNSNEIKKRVLFSKWEHTKIDMYIVNSIDNTITSNQTLREYNDIEISNSFVIKPKEKITLYLNVKVEDSMDDFYYLYVINPDDMINLIKKNEMFNNGIFLGILLAMMMYSFFMYFSIKEKSYLYLGLYQLSTVAYISDIKYYLIVLLEDYNEFSYWSIKIVLSFLLMPILSILFTKEFLSTKENMPFVNKLLNLFIIMLFIDLLLIGTTNIGYSMFLNVLFVFAGYYSLRQNNKFAFFYMLGFTPTVVYYVSANFIKVFDLNIDVSYYNSLQVIAVIEAFALSMALYLKLKQTVEEKELAKEELHAKEKMMLEQSRYATMGEMLASISHQWKQPLNHISTIFASLQMADETKNLTTQYLNKKTNEANAQIKYMATTIEDFNGFLSAKKEIEDFTLSEICETSIALTNPRIKRLNANIQLQIKNEKKYFGYKNGITQIVLIILNNALDALMLNNIENKIIKISIDENHITIEDNAGGIPENIIEKIYEPYFSTKGKNFGTGMGLYTAKLIMNTIIKGEISVENKNEGAIFTIVIPKDYC